MSEMEPQQQSIQARIAALNLGEVGRNPAGVPSKPSPRPPPPKPPIDRSTSAYSPTASSISNGIGNEPNGPSASLPSQSFAGRTGQNQNSSKPPPPPRLPPRRESTQHEQSSAPALPPRRPSGLSRKDSQESVSSVISSVSALSNGTSQSFASRTPSLDNSRMRVPVYDPTTLPPLPPSKREQQERKATKSSNTNELVPPSKSPLLPSRPRGTSPNAPSLPSRSFAPQRTASSGALPPHITPNSEAPPPAYARRLPPTTIPPVKARSENGPPVPAHPDPEVEMPRSKTFDRGPPPVPKSTRPDLSKIMATKPKTTMTTRPSGGVANQPTSRASCLKCRDFSGPDGHAARFPRQNVPSLDWLATQLTDPFPSLTDKARALFTWLHHNIDYNVEAFFSGNIKPSTPFTTLDTGLAVCEGYAGLFTALATKAGLESMVVGGHGKGFGSYALQPGERVPPKSSNHAWNAIKIDNGEWKLIDPCWGAGHVKGAGQPYSRAFNPTEFTKSNEEFGLKHYPTDPAHFFRSDGRIPTWEDYMIGEQPGELVQVYAAAAEGFSNTSFLPRQLKISTSAWAHTGPTVRFQFSRVCEHWDPMRNGKGKPFQYVLCLGVPASGGAEKNIIPFETNGKFWWADVPVEQLGAPGDKVQCAGVDTVGGQDARGLSKEEFLMAKGRKGWSWQAFAAWELV